MKSDLTANASPDPRRANRALAIWLGFWALAFTATHVPLRGPGPETPTGLDKLIHFGIYSLLTLFSWRYFILRNGSISSNRILAWVLIFLVYGALDEWSQRFVGRDPSYGDFLADAAGVMFGMLIVIVDVRRRRLKTW